MCSKLPRCILFGGSRVHRNKTFHLLSTPVIKRPRIFLVISRPDKSQTFSSLGQLDLDGYIYIKYRFQTVNRETESWKNGDHPRVKPRDNNKKYGVALDRCIISNRIEERCKRFSFFEKIRAKDTFEIGVIISEQSVKYHKFEIIEISKITITTTIIIRRMVQFFGWSRLCMR